MGRDLTSETRSLRLPLVGTLGLAFLAVVAVAFVFNDSDRSADRTDRLAAEAAPTEPAASDPSGAEDVTDDGPTGFYLPGDLPEGWTIRFEEITNPWSGMCPCERVYWRTTDGAELVASTSRQQNDLNDLPPNAGEETYRPIPGGYLNISPHGVSADWFDGEVTRGLYSTGLDATVVEQLALGWTGDSVLVPPVEFAKVWTRTTPAVERRTELFWVIGDGGDRSMVVHLSPWMYEEPADLAATYPDAEPAVLPGNGLPLLQTPEWSEPHLEGAWPGGALVTVAGSYGEINHGGSPLSREEMLDVAGGFRPASAEEWAAYVEDQYDAEAMEACRPLLVKAKLADLQVEPGAPDAEDDWEANGSCGGGRWPETGS